MERRPLLAQVRREVRPDELRRAAREALFYVRRSPRYAGWRWEVLSRAGGRCQWCGAEAPLEPHHSEALADVVQAVVAENGPCVPSWPKEACARVWDPANGRALCADCHDFCTVVRNVCRGWSLSAAVKERIRERFVWEWRMKHGNSGKKIAAGLFTEASGHDTMGAPAGVLVDK